MLILAAACAAPPAVPASLDDIAEGYVRSALQLAQHQPTLVENWRGNADWRPGPRQPIAVLRDRLAALSSTLARAPIAAGSTESTRARYLRRQLDALDVAARRLLGESTPFADEVLAAYGQPLPLVDPARADAARQTLARLLPADGALGSETLGARHAAFRRAVTVPANRAAAVLTAAIDACRDRTRAHVTLPPDEGVDLRLGADSPWDGFARYQGKGRSTIEISGGSPLDVSRALHLACHEAYPGHHTQDILLEAYAARSGRAELRLHPAFGPHLLIAEGAAEAGADLAFPPEERTRFYREVLLPAAGLPAERAETLVAVETAVFELETAIPSLIAAYLDGRATREATVQALEADAAVMEADALLTFAERQRTRAIAYTLGRQVIARMLARDGQDPWQTLTALFSERALVVDMDGTETGPQMARMADGGRRRR